MGRYRLYRDGKQIFTSDNVLMVQYWWLGDKKFHKEAKYEIIDSAGRVKLVTPAHYPVSIDTIVGEKN